jgi:opacity protein-like surface antigen
MRTLVIVFVALVLLAVPAAAQDTPRGELFGGYSYARLNPGGLAGDDFNLNGWHFAAQGNVTSFFGLVGEVSGHHGSRAGEDVNTQQALFGPRITLRGPLSVFGHALFGVARGNAGLFGATDSETAFGMAVGGGADINLGSQHVAWRVVQVDYLMTRWSERSRNNARVSTGLVVRF